MKVNFNFAKNGLEVRFKNTSREVPAGSTYLWDFGDYTGTSSDPNPVYTYSDEGFYLVKLTVTPPSPDEPVTIKLTIGLSLRAQTVLTDSIFNLFELRVPETMLVLLRPEDIRYYIQKWQLYLYSLVPSELDLQYAEDEMAYEALENQLVLEAAAYDWTIITAISLMQSLGQTISDEVTGSEGEVETGAQDVKSITTGPTKVEWFEGILAGDTASSMLKTLTGALSPGGIIDLMKQNLCMLAKRLTVYLPICSPNVHRVTPKKVNTREPGLLGGPNPAFPVSTGDIGTPVSKG